MVNQNFELLIREVTSNFINIVKWNWIYICRWTMTSVYKYQFSEFLKRADFTKMLETKTMETKTMEHFALGACFIKDFYRQQSALQ